MVRGLLVLSYIHSPWLRDFEAAFQFKVATLTGPAHGQMARLWPGDLPAPLGLQLEAR